MKALDLAPEDLKCIQAILEAELPSHEVWAFGSRVTGRAKPFSDLDLVIRTDHPLPISCLADLAEAFSDSKLAIKIDILDWSRLGPNFKQEILKAYLPLHVAKT